MLESKELFEKTFTCQSAAILVLDTGEPPKILECNPAATEIFGYSHDEMVGRTTEMLHVDGISVDDFLQYVKGINDAHVFPKTFEHYMRRKSGEIFISEHSVASLKDENNVHIGWVGVISDITGRKRTEEELRESEAKYRELTESITDVYFALDEDLRYTHWNKACETLTGVSAENAIGKYLYDIFPNTEQTEKAETVYRKVLKTKQPHHFVNEYHIGEKSYFFEINVYPAAKGLSVFVRDVTERKRTEDELRLQRDFAQSVFDTAQTIMLVLDKDGRINNYNHYMEEISGYRLDEVRGKDWFTTFLPEQDHNKIRQVFKQAINDIRIDGNINPIITKDGHLRDIEWYDKILKDINGNVVGLLAVGQDITERRKAEEKHQTILKTTLDGFWLTDLEGKFLEVNDAYCNMMGYTQQELLTMSIANLEVIDSPEDIQKRIKQICEQGSSRFESQHKCKDGRIIDVEVSANYLNIGDGQISIFVRDITRRKQTQERISSLNSTLNAIRNINQLLAREKDLDKLLKGVCDNLIASRCCEVAWIILVEESQKLMTYAMAGVSNGYLPVTELLKRGELPLCVQKAMKQERVLINKDPQTTCDVCPAGSDFAHMGCLTVRLEHKGNIYGVISAMITKDILSDKDEIILLKEAAADIAFALYNMELERDNQMLEQERLRAAKLESISTLAGGIAHDFNNLLTGIMGNISLSKMLVDPNEQIYKMMNEAEKAAERARDLTQQLLTFARGGETVKQSVNISELIKESATFALRGSAVKLELSLPDDLWSVEVDKGQINQVIQNLVINAEESMSRGGMLRIRAGNTVVKRAGTLPLPRGEYIVIDIEDTGTGISDENLERIFEPYFTTKKKGTGLGLSTAYSIVKNHGGYIVAESTEGKGTTFHVYLSASGKPSKAMEKLVLRDRTLTGGKILVMDDEEIIRHMLRNMLQVIGYKAEAAADGNETLKKYSRAMELGKPFDAVIMDLTIPGGMGGKETVTKLLEIDPEAQVIVSSGYATDTIMSEYKNFGFTAVIAKPYSVGQLEETLHALPKKEKRGKNRAQIKSAVGVKDGKR